MTTRSDLLKNAMSTVLSQYVPNAQEVLNGAEKRLMELEDRDARRRQREQASEDALAQTYPTLRKD